MARADTEAAGRIAIGGRRNIKVSISGGAAKSSIHQNGVSAHRQTALFVADGVMRNGTRGEAKLRRL